MRYLNEESGLTLVELLVFIAVFGLISTGLYNIFRVHNLMAAKQEETTLMQQELLSVMVQMADDADVWLLPKLKWSFRVCA
jgi:type II secretory pathway component PulJ